MFVESVDFSEEAEVKRAGMIYHKIPSRTNSRTKENIMDFLKIIEGIKAKGGKAHIHCKARADRTGMYAFIYKALNKIGTLAENEKEWLDRGHNTIRYPNLRVWAKNFIKSLKKNTSNKSGGIFFINLIKFKLQLLLLQLLHLELQPQLLQLLLPLLLLQQL